MTIIYHESDGDLDVLDNRIVGVIGYGSLASPIASNLQDSGVRVLIGVDKESHKRKAMADGFRPLTIDEVVERSHVVMILLPDEVMPEIYLEHISHHLMKGQTLIFASGYNVTFGFIEPPPFVDVGMVAPRTIGASIRNRYIEGKGFYSFVGVGQDASGKAWDTVLAVAKAIGSLKAGAVEVTMEQEAELDLFVQQAILPAFHHIMTTAAELLLRMGYPPEAAMLDLYVSGEFTDYMSWASNAGLLHALRLSSLTGQYGIFSRLSRFDDLKLERLMEITLDEIRDGEFAEEWAREYSNGLPHLKRLLSHQEKMELWQMEQQTIELLRGFDAPYDFD